MSKSMERLYNGLIKENPTFVLALGMCPTLAVTTSAKNGLGMGLTTMVVLALSNMIISLLRKVIPNRVRIPAFIVIIASFVTVVQLLLEAYLPDLNRSLGIYIPLIVVNCIILGRAESYAYKNPVLPSLFDGIGMGLGFSVALTLIGAFRELLGAGTLFDITVMPDRYEPISIFVMAPGAFFVLACLTALMNKMKASSARKEGKEESKPVGCAGACENCTEGGCAHRLIEPEQKHEEVPEAKPVEEKAEKPEENAENASDTEIEDTASAEAANLKPVELSMEEDFEVLDLNNLDEFPDVEDTKKEDEKND